MTFILDPFGELLPKRLVEGEIFLELYAVIFVPRDDNNRSPTFNRALDVSIPNSQHRRSMYRYLFAADNPE